MSLRLLSEEAVEAIHDQMLNPGELPGRARDKSLSEALARVENRVAYGLIEDAFDLAAMYAVAVATGHGFNDGNKRTAHQTMDVCLDINRIALAWRVEEVGPLIVEVAQGKVDESGLAAWLRGGARGA